MGAAVESRLRPGRAVLCMTKPSLVQLGLKPSLLADCRDVEAPSKKARPDCRAGSNLVAEGRIELPTFGL